MSLLVTGARRLAVPIALTAVLLAGGCQKASDEVFDARVRAYLLRHPEVIEEAVNKLNDNKAKEAAAKAQDMINRRREDIDHDPRDFVANPNGKVTVAEFYDYNCTYCRAAAPQILDLIRRNPDVRFVFKEFPIFGGDSDRAASLALAAKAQGKYLSLYQQFFSVPEHLDQPKMEQILAASGLDKATTEHEAVSDPVRKQLTDTHALAEQLGINGTPTFIVDGKMLTGADIPALTRAIADARKKA